MIIVSAGHYPDKPGVCHDGFCEHDEAARWVDVICAKLDELGVDNVKCPTGYLKGKIDFINHRNPKLAIEIHFGTGAGNGACTLYQPDSKDGKAYAELLQAAMEKTLSKNGDGSMEGWYRMDKTLGVDFFLRKTKCESLILEPEFIENKDVIQSNRIEVCQNLANAIGVICGI